MAEFTDEQVFGAAPAQAKGPTELSDDQVFGRQQGMSDEDVFGKPGVLGYAKELGKQVLTGGAETFATALRGLGTYGERPAGRELESGIEMAQRGILPGADEPLVVRPARSVTETPDYQAGETVSRVTKEALQPRNDLLNPVVQDVARGVGSVGANIATAFVPFAGPGILAAQGIGEAGERAVKAGATPEQQAQAGTLGSIAGLTDLADVLLANLGSTGKALGFISRVGKRAALGALTEGGQEGLQQFIQNVIAQGIYKPNQDLFEEVPYNAFIGAIVGGGVSAVAGGHGGAEAAVSAPPTGTASQLGEESLRVLQGTSPTAPMTLPGNLQTTAPTAVAPEAITPLVPSAQAATTPILKPLEPRGLPFPQEAMFSSLSGVNAQGERVFQRSNGFRQVEQADGRVVDEEQDYGKTRLPQFKVAEDFTDQHTSLNASFSEFGDGQRVQSPTGSVPVEGSTEPGMVFVPGNTVVQALPGDISFYPSQKTIATTVTGAPFNVTSLHSAFLSDWLNDLQPNPDVSEVSQFVHQLISQKLRQHVPDIMVHVISADDMARTNPNNRPSLGAYLSPNDKRFPHVILVNGNDIRANPASIAHVILHEGTHAATSKIMDADPVLTEQVRMLMEEVRSKIETIEQDEGLPTWTSVPTSVPGSLPGAAGYAFINEKEFLAEVFSNPAFQHILSNIQISPELRSKLGLEGKKLTLWQAFVQLVRRILNLPQTLEVYSMLEAALRVGSRIMDAQARLPGDSMRPNSTMEIDVVSDRVVERTNPADVNGFSSPQDVLSWIYNKFAEIRALKPRTDNEAVHFEEISLLTGKTPEQIGELLRAVASSPDLAIEGHYLWLARNTRQGANHMRVRLGNREYTGVKFLSGEQRRQANISIVSGLQDNINALEAEDPTINPSNEIRQVKVRIGQLVRDRNISKKGGYDVTGEDYAHYRNELKNLRQRLRELQSSVGAVGTQPETVGIRASIDNLFGNKVPPAVRAMGAHADKMNWLYKWMAGLDQVARANPSFAPLLRYVEGVRSMHIEETRIHDAAVRIGKDWLHLGDRGEQLSAFIDDITHMSYRNDVEVRNGIVRHPTTAEFNALATKYKMDTEMHETFRKITTMLMGVNGKGGFIELIEQSAIQHIRNTVADPVLAAARIRGIEKQVQDLRKRPYFPFTNFGRNYILMKDPAGKLIHFETVERSGLKTAKRVQNSRARELSRLWEQDYGRAPVQQTEVVIGVLPEHVSPMIGMPAVLLDQMADVMNMTPAQINSMKWLQVADMAGAQPMLNPRYQKKFYVPGYGMMVPGYSMDLRRSFARFFFHGAKYYSKSKYIDGLRELVKTAELTPGITQGEVASYMRDHLQNTIIDAKGDFGFFKGAIFFWAMGYVPAAATQNLSQVPMITFPFLAAKFGDARASVALVNAMRKVSTFYKRGTYDAHTSFEMKAFEYGIRTGRITETMAPEIAGMSQNSLLQGVGGNVTQRNWQRFMQGASWMFETAEQFNRRVSFRAALELATKNPKSKFIDEAISFHKEEYNQLLASMPEAEARAIIAAVNVVEQTQYTYARWARPRFMRGPLAGTLFVFKKYIQSTLFMLGQNPDVFWRYALISMLIGGLGGLPGMEDLLSLIKAAGRWFGGRDWNVEHEARRHVTNLTDGTIDPDIVLHGFARRGLGLPALLDMIGSFATGTPGRGLAAPKHVRDPLTGQSTPQGFAQNIPFPVLDRSRALGMGLILPFDLGKLATPTEDLNRNIAEQAQKASGAVFSVGFNIYKAAMDNHLAAADWKRWERAVPRLLGDTSQAWRSFSEGRERSKGGPAGGSTIVNYDVRDTEQMMEIAAIQMGYQPLRLQARWDNIMAKMEVQKYYDLQRNGLLESMNEARSGKNQEEMQRVTQSIKEFNMGLPDWAKGRAITADTITKSMQTRERARQQRESGIPGQKGNIPIAREIDRLYPESTIDVRPARR